MDIKPFNRLKLTQFFIHDLEKIMMSFRLSSTLQTDASNIRAAGDEVELAVKDFFTRKLTPKYHICDGHIVDSSLKISPQFDIIISENSKNPVLFNLADKSEIVYFEPVFAYGEVKKSFYKKDLVEKFSTNIARLKQELQREMIPANFIETGSTGILVESPLTNLPLRNPLLTFMFFIDDGKLSTKNLGTFFKKTKAAHLPNYLVFLNTGLVVNVHKNDYKQGKIKINLYPEYESEENIWVLLSFPDANSVLTYQYMLLIQHLNNTTVGFPDVARYTSKLFDISPLDDVIEL